MVYLDSLGHPLDRGDQVRVFGHDGMFEIASFRAEGVAVIRNLAPGYDHTSTVALTRLTLASARTPF